NGVPIYKGAAEMQLKAEDKLGVARKGAEIILIDKDNPSVRSNEKNESQPYQLAHYAVPKAGDPELFYIAAKYINAECKTKPNWLIPPESKPARYTVPNNTWLRKTADSTEESTGVPASSEVVLLGEQQMVTINGGLTDFRQVQVFKVGNGTVKNSANQVMANASKGSIGWLAKNKFGAALTAESSIPIEFDKVVLRDSNPIAVQAGEVIGHWGEHQVATLSMSGFSIDPDQKAVHFEVFVGEKDKRDKQELNDCIQNQAQVTGGQDYLVLNKDKVVTYRLINHKKQLSYEALAKFGPLNTPLAVKKTDIVTHGTQKFVRVRERAAEKDELAGEFVLLSGDAELLSQHDWGKLGVKLVDGSNDPDGFLDKEDTEGQEGGVFFSSLYDRLTIDRDNDNVLSGNEIKSALADDDLASKLRQLFIKHESEWIKREKGWPRLEKELAKQPELYKYAMQVHNNMAWVEEVKGLLGGTKMWFIHPAGMMGLVGERKTSRACDCERLYADKFKVTRSKRKYGPVYWGTITLASYSGWSNLLATGKITENEKVILVAMSENEGKMDAIQSYDSEVVTAGAMQKTFKDGVGLEGKGELSIQLAKFRDKYPDLYANHMSNCGWIVEGTGSSAITYYVDDLLTGGGKVTGRDLKNLLRKGCDESTFNSVIHSKPLAGLLKVISLPEFLDMQVLDFIERLHSAESHVVFSGDIRIKDYIKSDFGRAVVLDHSVNRPGFVKDNFKMAISNFHTKNPNVSLNPHDWAELHETYEKKLLDEYKMTRSMTNSISRYNSLRIKL
ncbi:MAG TPA: hypothetical protein DCF97_12060, partial [Plesiomonas shigelloides]|nr:hypothetical protein [Plesiomonas shigelloides]